MASTYIAPLDLKYIFLNVFAGSTEIFMGLFFIGISILAGIFKMPSQIYLLMIALSAVILYLDFGAGFYPFVILIAGLITYMAVSRIVKD